MLQIAKEAKRCRLENTTSPHGPSLSESDMADAELFLSDVLLCLPLVGISFFSNPSSYQYDSPLFYLNAKGLKSVGYEIPSGFVTKAGSQASKEEVSSIHKYLSAIRSNLMADGALSDRGSHLHLREDFVFNSPSEAAGVMLGQAANGRDEWKDSEGLTLKTVQEAKIGAL